MSKRSELHNPKLDIVRCFALFCVIGVHFFLNTGFYDVTIVGIGMYFLVLVRNFFMICVPLFLILSGYLLKNKEVSTSYYLRIIPILGVYLLASFVCSLYRFVFLPEEFSVTSTIAGLFGYYAAPYGWYIEMYIGLFLLIPFLNILYKHIPTKKFKRVFILSLVLLSGGSSLVNDFFPLFPGYWTCIYPITFYFIGCYLAEYPIKLKPLFNLVLIAVAFLISGSVSYFFSYGSVFQYGQWQEHYSILTTLQTVLVFTFIMQGNCSRISTKISKILSYVSNCCLGAYLVSWVFDSIFYGLLNSYQPTVFDKAKFFVPVTIAVYICSLILSAVLNGVYKLTIGRIVHRLLRTQKATAV